MPHSAYTPLALGWLVLVVAFALLCGGREERRGALLGGAAWIAILAAQRLGGRPDPVALLAAVDAAVLVGFLGLSWRSERIWPLAACACQGVALAVHAIRAFSPHMAVGAYLTALAVPSCSLLLALAAGTGAAIWRRRRGRRIGLSS